MKKYFKDTGNFISFGLALIPSILLYIFSPRSPVPYALFVILLLLLLLASWLAVKLYLELKSAHDINQIVIIDCYTGRCICQPNNLISYGSIVSFYENVGECEKFLCFGSVETITQKGLAQIILHVRTDSEKESILQYVHEHKDKILIRPTITKESLATIYTILAREDSI